MSSSRNLGVAVGLILMVTAGLPALECEKERFGAGITISERTELEALLKEPERFVGKTVRVEGVVEAVCESSGCWMEIRAGQGASSVRVKVEDGVIVFPISARGKRAEAQGVFQRYEMGRSEYETHLRHLAAERGEKFDASNVGEGPFRVYQIEGTGAEICK